MLDFTGLADMANMKRGHAEIVFNLDLKNVFADPNQPRKEFDEDSITDLAEDIRRNGLIQPIVVKHYPDQPGNYMVVAGERRLRAVQKLGQPTIKAILKKDYSAQADLGYIQIAENIKRDDLKFYELAEFIISREAQGETHEQIAQKLGLTRPRVTLYASWKNAPDFLKQAKQHFRAIRPFSLLSKLVQDYLQEVQDYVSKLESDELVTEKDVIRFRQQIAGNSQNTSDTVASLPDGTSGDDTPATAEDVLPSFESHGQPGSHTGNKQQSSQPAADKSQADTPSSLANSGGNDTPAPQDTPAGNASPATTSLTDSTGPSDTPAATHGGSDGQTTPSEALSPLANSLSASAPTQGALPSASGPAVSSPSFEGRLQPGSNSGDEQQFSQVRSGHPAEGTDQVHNAVRYKRPQLLGTVDSRPATLLYREIAEQDDLVVVRYEDGTRSQVQAKSFVLCRICEG